MRRPTSASTLLPHRQMPAGAIRMAWGVADQAASSLTNVIVGVLVARTLGPAGFGAFSIAFATYLIAMSMSRGMSSDPLMVRFSDVDPAIWKRAVRGSTGTALAIGVLAGSACAVVATTVGGPTGPALLALGITLPGLLLQDSWRFAFFSQGRPALALANDVVWAVALVALLWLVVVSGTSSQFLFMLAWGGSATIAAVVGAAQARLVPRLSAARMWVRENRHLCFRYVVENLSTVSGTQLRFYGLAAIVGLAGVGAMRAAELLLGPVLVVILGMGMMAVPEMVRLLRMSTSRALQLSLLVSSLGTVSAVLWGTLVLLLPDNLGQRILGTSWDAAAVLILPTTVVVTATAVQIGAWAGVRGLAAASRSLLSQCVGSTAYIVGALTGGTWAGTLGAAWGTAAAAIFAAAFWWWQFRLGLRDRLESTPR